MSRLRAAFDLAAWPCLATLAAVTYAIDGGRLLRWLRATPAYDEDVVA